MACVRLGIFLNAAHGAGKNCLNERHDVDALACFALLSSVLSMERPCYSRTSFLGSHHYQRDVADVRLVRDGAAEKMKRNGNMSIHYHLLRVASDDEFSWKGSRSCSRKRRRPWSRDGAIGRD
jgi:hypothetical protein